MQIHNEIILIAGKGHEEKQIYKNKIINISDKKIIKKNKIKIKILKKKKNYFQNKLILKKFWVKKNLLILMVSLLILEQLKKIIYF